MSKLPDLVERTIDLGKHQVTIRVRPQRTGERDSDYDWYLRTEANRELAGQQQSGHSLELQSRAAQSDYATIRRITRGQQISSSSTLSEVTQRWQEIRHQRRQDSRHNGNG